MASVRRIVVTGLAAIFLIGVGVVAIYVIPILIFAFGMASAGTTDEVARVTSPDGKLDAVVYEVNAGGALTSFGYDVFILPPGKDSRRNAAISLYGARRSDCAYGINLRWTSNRSLRVEYLKALQASDPETKVLAGDILIAVSLVDGINDPAAPCGPMARSVNPTGKAQ